MADHVCTTVSELNTALANAVAGDNILVRAGYYQTTNTGTDARVNGGFTFGHSGTTGNPITLTNYPGDAIPTLANRPSGSSAYFAFPTITFGLHSNITIDGIKVDGAVFMFIPNDQWSISGTSMSGGQTRNTIKNCEIWEGWETIAAGGDGNWSGIRCEGQTFALLQNNYIHDINNLGNCNNLSSMTGIKLFSSIDTIVENNTVRRVVGYSQAACLDDKQDSIRNTHRYNWFENVSTGPRIQNQTSSGAAASTGTKFYQNVIILGNYNGRAFTHEDGLIADYEFYNNTIIVQAGSMAPGSDDGMAYASAFASSAGAKFYNNIFYSPTSSKNLTAYSAMFGSGGLCNYNHYSDTSLDFRYGATTYTDLSAFQGAGLDTNASSGNPLFTNLGSLILTLQGGSPCVNTGKVGGVGSGSNVSKGAYITGAETIGFTAGASPSASVSASPSRSPSPSASASPSASGSPSPSPSAVSPPLPLARFLSTEFRARWRFEDLSYTSYWFIARGDLSPSSSVSPSPSAGSPSSSVSASASPSSSISRSPSASPSPSASISRSPSASPSPSSSVSRSPSPSLSPSASASASPSPSAVAVATSVHLTSIGIELGLGGRMRDIFVNEDFTQCCLPLSELFSTTFRDISGLRNHATLTGTGHTRGVPTGLPEQHMGLSVDGNGGFSIADDGNTSGGLSLANGSIDIAFLVKPVTSDATERVIITNRNGSGHGWYVGMVSGAIRFRLTTTAGTTVFNFTRGSIVDGAWHLVHCYYDPPTQEARIFIDGVQSGATVATTNTDPQYIGVGVKGLSGDPGGASNFIGSVAFMDLGREGNLTLSASLQAARVWTNVAADVRLSEGLRVRYGSSGRLATDWVASTGTCTFVLDNSTGNSAALTGLYSPNHANKRSGFGLGIPVRVAFVYGSLTRYKFQGRIVSIAPEAGPVGVAGSRGTRVMATDWLDVAARSRFIGAQTQVGLLSTDVLKYLMEFGDQSPGSVSIDTGSQVFGFALDQARSERDTMLSEFARLAPSEMMYLFMRGNDTDGMTFVASTRFARSADATLDATFTNSMRDLELSVGTDGIINEVRASCYPPTVDAAATSVLFSLTANSTVTHPIPPGQSVTIDAPFTDPNDRPTDVGATALVTPVATTDYTGNSAADGTGIDLTSSMSVTATLGASAMRAVVTNTGSSTVYLTKLQIRGKGIYRYQQAPAIAIDTESVQKYGTSSLDLDMPYQQNVAIAQSVATAVVDIYGQPTTRPVRMTLAANHDDTVMTQSLTREIGDHIGIVETVSGLVAGDGYFISEVDIECHGLHDLRVAWGLIPPWPPRLLVSYTGPLGTQVHDLDVASLELVDAGDYTFMFNRTGDTVIVRGAGGGGGGGGGSFSGGGGGGAGAINTFGVSVSVVTSTYSGKVGAPGTGGTGASGTVGGSGASGGTSEFRVPAGTIHLQLAGGTGGGGASGTTVGAGGSGASAGTGSGNVAGTAGGSGGGVNQNGFAGAANSTGAGGGGGGGYFVGFAGGAGGDGQASSGGAGGNAFVNGTSSSGSGGLSGTGDDRGGGGGGAGGVLLAGATRGGGGGGGGGGSTSGGGSGGVGGAGSRGCLTITKV